MFSTTAEYPIAFLAGELDPEDHVSMREPMMRWDALVLLLVGALAFHFA
ncbi:MAG: hypothetical protein IBJ03_05695 [Gemmatimonadaceae bacterium]|nr:hypothetical protein [Gemmatimonadaceae bacterium]